MPVRIAPTLAGMATYPFVRLEEARRRLVADGVEVIDFGKGDPNEPTDPIIREALVAAVPERSPYPLAQGLPELREAVAGWCARRFGVELDPDTEIVPTYGSKEAIFSIAQVLLDPASEKRLVLWGEPAYPVYERGALFAGGDVGTVPLVRENGFVPISTPSTRRPGRGRRSSGSTIRTTRPVRSRRCRSTSSSPPSRRGTTSSSPRTRRTPSCGSTSRRRPRCRQPTGVARSSSRR